MKVLSQRRGEDGGCKRSFFPLIGGVQGELFTPGRGEGDGLFTPGQGQRAWKKEEGG